MKNLLKIVFVVALLLSSHAYSQKKTSRNSLSKSAYATQIQNYFNSNQSKFAKEDISSLVISDEYYSKSSGITHIYVQQTFNGIKIHNAISSIAVKNENIVHVGNVFKTNISQKVNTTTPSITAQQAISNAANHFNLGATSNLRILSKKESNFTFSNGNISQKDIPVELVYTVTNDDQLKLSWNLEIFTLDNQNMWSVRIDATDGKVLDQMNYMISCNFEDPNHDASHKHGHKEKATSPTLNLFKGNTSMMVDGSSYSVYALPTESPTHGEFVTVNDPANVDASPFGWHDTNGRAGAEFTITRGNNVYAQEDRNGNNGFGDAPDGGADLNFDFNADLTQDPAQYIPAATTNLFYLNNMMHDIWYAYGFDEASGNFQENNYDKGGRGGDSVTADAQDGSGTNNANFGTPPDGSNPRMQMFLWSGPNPDRDGDFDNGIIAHEFGHGISTRLAGGPSTSGCLSGREQQGEGWSDWFALMITMKPGDLGPDRRGIGTYALAQPTTGGGIRTFPYSTSFNTNPHTYDDISRERVPHGVGSVWAAVLWDLAWAYVDKYGWDEDLYRGTGGNNKVMQLVLDGLKLQPCGSGFVDSRDALLAADSITTGGDDQCLIWEVFAKRGLGFSADQGTSGSNTDGTEAFDLPEALITVSKIADACGNEIPTLKVTNFTGEAISEFDYNFTIDGGTPVNETWNGNLEACGSAGVELDLGTLTRGSHEIVFNIIDPAGTKTFTVLANDFGLENDVNEFETEADVLITNDADSWERGDANGTLLNATVAGSKVYGTNLGGNHDNQKTSYLVSQCYDLSDVDNSFIKFDMAFDFEQDFDLLYMEYSKDGETWEILGTAADTDWYNSDRTPNQVDCQNCVGAQWTGEGEKTSTHSTGGTNAGSMKNYSYSLSDFDSSGSAETNMLFRFVLRTDPAVVEEGAIIDNFVIEGNALSVEDNVFNKGLSVYPNPTNGTVTIQSAVAINNAKIAVRDVMGRTLTNSISVNAVDNNKVTVDISQFSTGAYFLTIDNGNSKATKRIIKN